MSQRGKYIVIEGTDGTGKSGQVERLHEHLQKLGIKSVTVHEPAGVLISEKLRAIIVDDTLKREPWTNVMLFTTARRANWFQQMKPALEKGIHVIASRNWLSTVAYQGYGQGMPITKIRHFTEENVSSDYLKPDLTLILSLDDEKTRKARILDRSKPDVFESMPDEFQKRLKHAYTDLADKNNFPVIDASLTKDEVENLIWAHVESLLPRN